jgi:hypothetical protein
MPSKSCNTLEKLLISRDGGFGQHIVAASAANPALFPVSRLTVEVPWIGSEFPITAGGSLVGGEISAGIVVISVQLPESDAHDPLR